MELDHCGEVLKNIIVSAFENNCRLRTKPVQKGAPWWNPTLETLKKKSRRLYNRSNKTNNPANREAFRDAQRKCKKEIERANNNGWKNFCESMSSVSDTARLLKLLKQPKTQGPNLIRLGTGEWAEDERSALDCLLDKHFPQHDTVTMEQHELRASGADWELARRICAEDRVRCAMSTFDPFKVPGTDGIFPALLQKGLDLLAPILVKLFRACLAFGYIPECWQVAKVLFMPKPSIAQHSKPKDYRPISLTSFVLKTMERLVDRYIREEPLAAHPLHDRQHAYQTGKSVDTTLAEAVTFVNASGRQTPEIGK